MLIGFDLKMVTVTSVTMSPFRHKTTNIVNKIDLGPAKLKEPKITIEADGKVIYTSKEFDTKGTNIDVSVDLTDVKRRVDNPNDKKNKQSKINKKSTGKKIENKIV